MFLGSTLIGGIALLNNDDYDSQLKRSVISGQRVNSVLNIRVSFGI